MTKKSKRFDDEHEGQYEPGYHDRLLQHRKDKKIKNALRSKNIYDLIDDDEDEY
jgi:hypothetical protein